MRPARLLRRSRFRSASRRSPARSSLPAQLGRDRSTPTSRTSTGWTAAATSPPGRSRSSSPPRYGLHSAHCANDATVFGSSARPCMGTRLANGVGSTRRPGLRNARNGAVSGVRPRRSLWTTTASSVDPEAESPLPLRPARSPPLPTCGSGRRPGVTPGATTRSHADSVAERAVVLGYVPDGQAQAVAAGSPLATVAQGPLEDHVVVRELVNRIALSRRMC